MATINTILCALDLSEHSKIVADYAAMYARLCNAKVILVYVAPTMSQYTGFHVAPSTIDGFVGEIVTGAENAIVDFSSNHFAGIEVETRVLVGYAKEEILTTAETTKADLIVMGTHGRKGIDRMLFGSVAEKVVKESPIPVLTVRPVCSPLDAECFENEREAAKNKAS